MHLVRDVLDKQLVSAKNGQPMGMADGLVLELREAEPPRIVSIECGLPVLAREIHPRLERIIQKIGRRWGVRRGRIYRIPWARGRDVGIDIKLSLDAETSPAGGWERWLRRRVLSWIPGGSK